MRATATRSEEPSQDRPPAAGVRTALGSCAAAAVTTVALVVLALTTTTPAALATPGQGGAGQSGAELYGRDCAGCHGPEGEGSPRGVPLTRSGEAIAHYMLVTGRMPLDDLDGQPRRSSSPYTEDEIEALVDHVAELGDGPALPDVDPATGDLGQGGELYRLHCGACHSSTAIGGALAFDRFAPTLMQSEPSVVTAAITAGPGAMPSFDPQGFTDEELASIVAYVDVLQHPVDRGGWAMLRAGRSDETAFAWLVALPTLLVLAGWIARRAR